MVNFLDTTDDKDLPSFATKKWIEVYDQSRANERIPMLTKKLELKLQC